MKLQHIKGNLLDFPNGINVICQNCNCQAVQGAGLALQIKNRYPKAYEADKTHHAVYQNKGVSQLGSYSSAIVGENKIIVNLYGQDGYGTATRQLNYEAIYKSMETIAKNMSQKPHASYIIGFPYGMGAGLAGGNWAVIESMINAIFEPTEIPVFVVKFSN